MTIDIDKIVCYTDRKIVRGDKQMEQQYPRNILEAIDFFLDQGYSEEVAGRLADQEFNPNYNADDYDGGQS